MRRVALALTTLLLSCTPNRVSVLVPIEADAASTTLDAGTAATDVAGTSTTDASTIPTDAASSADAGNGNAAPEVCPSAHWCWELPVPQGNDLYAIQVVGLDDVWAAGEAGAIVHSLAGRATLVASGVTTHLRGLYAVGQDGWAVGDDGVILRKRGDVFTPEASAGDVILRAVHGTSTGDAWAVGDRGTILHLGAGGWTRDTTFGLTEDLYSVWAMASDDVWAVGKRGAIAHYDGARWRSVTSSSTVDLTGVSGSPAALYAVGMLSSPIAEPTILRRDGASWVAATTSTSAFYGVWVSAQGDVFAVGPNQRLMRHLVSDGGWGESYFGGPEPVRHSYAITGNADGELWIALHHGLIQHHFDETHSEQVGAIGGTTALAAITGSSATDVWIAGERVLRRNVGGWSFVAQPSTSGLIFVASPTDAWTAEQGAAHHFDGTRWTRTTFPNTVAPTGIWASATDDVWIVSSSFHRAHWNGRRWSIVESPGGESGIWGSAADDIWVSMTSTGAMGRYDGARWSLVPTGRAAGTLAVFGTARDDVWAIGVDGAALHYDGTRWSVVRDDPARPLLAGFARGRSDVWASGPGGLTHHFDGAAWTEIPSNVPQALTGIWAAPTGEVLAVGDRGAVLRYRP